MPNDENQKPTTEEVELMARLLAIEFENPRFFKWYCGVVHQFGPVQVEEWRLKAGEGKEPGKLFSKLVSEARRKLSGSSS